MTDVQLTRALMAHEQREADRALLQDHPTKTERSYAIAAYKAATARELRLQMIAKGRARYEAAA